MDLSDGRALERRPALVFSPHPILLGKEQELVYALFLPNETVLEYLRRTGLIERMARQPFVLTIDGRRLPRALWARCRPRPGTLINLYAVVHGGDGGKKNPLATIALLALTFYAPGAAGTLAGAGATAGTVALYQAGIMVVGGMIINSIFPPPRPDLARAQNLGGGDSPTYAIQGGSNRMRRYEPMPKICGVHRVFPDFGAQPYNEFEGNDQVGYYVFDLGYNDAELTDFKIGDTPIEDFEGIELEISGADGALALFPGNVDSIAGVELAAALGFVSRTSSPDARSIAVELTGALFYLGDEGTLPRAASVALEYRPVGAGSWTPLSFQADTTPATSIVEGVARLPLAQYQQGVRKEITAQPPSWSGAGLVTVLSASINAAEGTGQLRAIYDKNDQTSVRIRWVPFDELGSPGGPFVQVRGGGVFVLYSGDGKKNITISVPPGVTSTAMVATPAPVFDTVTVGATPIAGELLLINATREPLRRTLKWHVAEGQYEVRVKKATPDEVNQRAQAQIVWSQLRTYQADDADYTGRLRVGMKVRASALANGVLQQLSCIARARTLPPDFEWAGLEDDPALAFDFLDATLEPKVGGAAIAVTRAGATATRVNELGLIETVAADTPRFDFDPVTLECMGLLIEGARTNRVVDKRLSAASWSKDNCSIGTAIAAPDGAVEFDEVVENSSTGLHRFLAGIGTIGRNTQVEVSLFVKRGAGTRSVALQITAGSVNYAYVTFNLSTLAVGESPSGNGAIAESGIEDWGSGVYRCWFVGTVDTTDATAGFSFCGYMLNASMVNSYTGDGVSSLYAWGGQVASGPSKTSVIPTGGAAVTRNTDVPLLPPASWFNESESTIVYEFTKPDIPHQGGGATAAVLARSASARAGYIVSGGSALSGYDGVNIVPGANITANSVVRAAYAFSAGGQAMSVDGGSVNAATFDGTWDSGQNFGIGCFNTGSGQLNGHFRRFTYYPKRLSNAALQTLSAEGPGVFARSHTSNPAWWYLDALRGKTINGRRVYGGGLPDTRIDITGLTAFAQWCVDEGLEFNGVFDQQTSLYELLSAIALMGRGTPTMQTGKHGVLWDAPNLPVTALFGMHNIMPGTFKIDYATGDLADVIEGWFINTELGWQRDFVRALVPGATSQARVRRVELFGCTNKTQAGQATSLYAAANFYRPRRYQWRSDWEQMPSPRGDVVELGHDLLNLLSGRFIEGGDASTLKLPRQVPLYATGGFVTVVEPNGDFATYAVDGGAGMTDTLTLPSPLPFDPWADAQHPPYDYRWHYGPASTTGRKVKIESFKPVSARYVDVTAVDEDPAYYTSKDNPLVALPAPHLFGQVQLQAVNVTEDGVRAGTGYLAKVLVSWDVLGDYGFADVRASIAGGPAELLAAGVRGRSYAFNVQDFTDVVVEVTAWSSFGRHGNSSRLAVEHHVNYAGQSLPSDVRNFFLDGDKFRWSAVPEVDVVGYRIRYHFGENLSPDDAHELHAALLSASPAQFEVLPAGVVTFFLTAVDAAQLESAVPAIIVMDLGDPEIANVVEEKDFKAEAWPGTITGGADVGGDLEADGTTAFYGSDSAPFYGAGAADFYEAEVYEEMVYESVGFYFSTDWIGSEMTLEHTLEGEGLNIEYRQSNDEPFYGADGDAFYGSDNDPFYGEVGDWRAWPGTVTFDGGDYQLRVTTGAGPIQGAVRRLTVVIDVPDVVEELNDIAIPAGGVRLALTKDFDLIKTVQLTLQTGDGDAVSARALDKDVVLGPLVECIDEAKVSVAGILDATITGR